MFVSFEPLIFLFWVFVSAFVPGAILSFSILKKDDFLFIEKLMIGFALGFVILPLIPFLLYFVAGVKFSYMIALLSVALLYIIAIAAFIYTKSYEGLKLPEMPKFDAEQVSISNSAVISAFLILILLLSFMVRFSSYSPIFQELDPYYYTYAAQQIVQFGENPLDDQTAWFSYGSDHLVVDHRTVPALIYLEATWYSLYTSGAEFENMLFALTASLYPPIAAVLSVFFIYLFVSTVTKREWGLISAGIATFVPIFMVKLAAGEQEVQPYAFFAVAFFYAMYALTLIKKGDLKFPVLAGFAFLAVANGCNSQILPVVSLMLFLVLHSLVLFFREKDEKELYSLLVSNLVILAIGPLFGSMILRDIFMIGYPTVSLVAPFFVAVGFIALLYLLKQRVPDEKKARMILGGIFVLGILLFAFTPLRDYVTKAASQGFAIAEFKFPLERTIAEQNLAPRDMSDSMGFVAEQYTVVVSTLLTPVTAILRLGSESAASTLEGALGWLFSSIFLLISVPVNLIIALFVGIVNVVLGTKVEFIDKTNSLLLFWVATFWVAVGHAAYRFIRKEEDNLSILMLAFVMPAFVVGIIKAKYTIYASVLLAMAIGFTLFQFVSLLKNLFDDDAMKQKIYRILLATGILLVVLQFTYLGIAPSYLWGSAVQLYQNNPDALAAKFQQFCDESNDALACAAADDPIGYAGKGTNYQYNSKLCMLSVFSEYEYYTYLQQGNRGSIPSWEYQAAMFRCQRLSQYWIESMEWIRYETEDDSRTTSWWDYGHWINYFGQKDTVLRNEHRSKEMIGAVAHGYLDDTPAELKEWMKEHDSEYALFDLELVFSGSSLGGKYAALNYLSCAYNNETTVEFKQMQSQCEADHLWEVIYVSSQPCIISSLSNKTGNVAYKVNLDVYDQDENGDVYYIGTFYNPYYPGICVNPSDPSDINYCSNAVHMVPTYCVGEVTLASQQQAVGTYYLNETYPNGDLKLNKGFLQFPFQYMTYHVGPVTGATVLYTNEAAWFENGEIKSGFEDRKGKFYDSNLYNALFLNNLPGFELAFASTGEAVKIYKIAD